LQLPALNAAATPSFRTSPHHPLTPAAPRRRSGGHRNKTGIKKTGRSRRSPFQLEQKIAIVLRTCKATRIR
jgi:hypothetical protein